MISLILQREIQDERASMGRLFTKNGDSEIHFLFTLENPWLANQPNISCIPAGDYVCRRVISPKYGETFEVTDVDGRTHILFHWGNYPSNTQGCILVGTSHAPEVPAVWNSRAAHAEFMDKFNGVDEFELTVLNPYEEAA